MQQQIKFRIFYENIIQITSCHPERQRRIYPRSPNHCDDHPLVK